MNHPGQCYEPVPAQAVQGPDWVCVNREAPWQARDSQGYFVHDGKMWMFGGWFHPEKPNPRDVWNSADGRTWTEVLPEAPWIHADMSACVVHDGRMWLMGGRKLPGAENSNKVWSSRDGADWTLEAEAGWSPRVCHAYAVFRDRIWIMGGTENWYDDNESTVKKDIWSSADGKAWELQSSAAPWGARRDARLFVFRDNLWLIGGGTLHPVTAPRNDVWCSADGVEWDQVTANAPWEPRHWFAQVVYRDRIWIMGGWNPQHQNFNDIWFTENGRDWTEVECSGIWTPRHQPSAYVFQDKVWIAGGHARPVNSEVWSWHVPPDWPPLR